MSLLIYHPQTQPLLILPAMCVTYQKPALLLEARMGCQELELRTYKTKLSPARVL